MSGPPEGVAVQGLGSIIGGGRAGCLPGRIFWNWKLVRAEGQLGEGWLRWWSAFGGSISTRLQMVLVMALRAAGESAIMRLW